MVSSTCILDVVPTGRDRPHTGRRRNEAARRAVLEAAADLLGRSGEATTVDAIAAAAGVGRQTIYRWWPSKGAVLLEAMTEQARRDVPAVDTGSLLGDLEGFLMATFRAASDAPGRSLLRSVMAQALHDPHAAGVLSRFTEQRRQELRAILSRGQARGQLPSSADLDLAVDQAYGLLWYRILLGHAPLTAEVARRLARTLARQLEA
jgi:AcrR family transcriptional regulator